MGELRRRVSTKKTSEPSYMGPWITNKASVSMSTEGSMRISTPRLPEPPAELVLVFVKDQEPTVQLLRQIRSSISNASSKTKVVGYAIDSQNWGISRLHSTISDLLLVEFSEFYRRKEWKGGGLSLMPDLGDYVVDYFGDTDIGSYRVAFSVVHKVAVQ
jgi:hypothetical protein